MIAANRRSVGALLVVLLAGGVTWLFIVRPGLARSQTTQTFGMFSRPAVAEDALPANMPITGNAVRRIGSTGAAIGEWAVRTGDKVCVLVDASAGPAEGGPNACNSLSQLTANDQLLVMGASSGPPVSAGAAAGPIPPPQILAGITPDGVKSVTITFTDGSRATAAVSNNGFEVATGGKTPHTFSWQTSDGVTHQQGAGG